MRMVERDDFDPELIGDVLRQVARGVGDDTDAVGAHEGGRVLVAASGDSAASSLPSSRPVALMLALAAAIASRWPLRTGWRAAAVAVGAASSTLAHVAHPPGEHHQQERTGEQVAEAAERIDAGGERHGRGENVAGRCEHGERDGEAAVGASLDLDVDRGERLRRQSRLVTSPSGKSSFELLMCTRTESGTSLRVVELDRHCCRATGEREREPAWAPPRRRGWRPVRRRCAAALALDLFVGERAGGQHVDRRVATRPRRGSPTGSMLPVRAASPRSSCTTARCVRRCCPSTVVGQARRSPHRRCRQHQVVGAHAERVERGGHQAGRVGEQRGDGSVRVGVGQATGRWCRA